jgi:AraC-like DNA-binding protein
MVDSISSVDRLTIGVKPQLTGEFSKIILNFIPDNPYIYSDTVTEEMKHTLKRLFELNHECNKTEYSFIIIKSYMQILLGLLIPELNLKKSSPPEDYLLQKAVNYIFENFNEPLSLELVAKHIGTNKCHLSTVFSKKMHVVFNHYINDVRLNFAVHHLRNSDEPITKIAYDCGFGALRTFNRIFKNKYQITPNQFRNLQKTKQQ